MKIEKEKEEREKKLRDEAERQRVEADEQRKKLEEKALMIKNQEQIMRERIAEVGMYARRCLCMYVCMHATLGSVCSTGVTHS
jgi:hypothetical protein